MKTTCTRIGGILTFIFYEIVYEEHHTIKTTKARFLSVQQTHSLSVVQYGTVRTSLAFNLHITLFLDNIRGGQHPHSTMRRY